MTLLLVLTAGFICACGTYLALGRQLLLSHVAAVGGTALQQVVRHFRMPGPELRLVILVTVPVEVQPAHAFEDGRNCRLGGARLVGILDPKQELAAVVAGEEPVEQGGAGAPDVQEAGGRWRDPCDHGT